MSSSLFHVEFGVFFVSECWNKYKLVFLSISLYLYTRKKLCGNVTFSLFFTAKEAAGGQTQNKESPKDLE